MAKDDIKLAEHRQTLKLHYQPAVIRTYLRQLSARALKDSDNEKDDTKKKNMMAIHFVYEDALEVINWAFSHLAPAPKEDDTAKRQDS